jgi:hypothetical protein
LPRRTQLRAKRDALATELAAHRGSRESTPEVERSLAAEPSVSSPSDAGDALLATLGALKL